MDDALVQVKKNLVVRGVNVLILVLMDDALVLLREVITDECLES